MRLVSRDSLSIISYQNRFVKHFEKLFKKFFVCLGPISLIDAAAARSSRDSLPIISYRIPFVKRFKQLFLRCFSALIGRPMMGAALLTRQLGYNTIFLLQSQLIFRTFSFFLTFFGQFLRHTRYCVFCSLQDHKISCPAKPNQITCRRGHRYVIIRKKRRKRRSPGQNANRPPGKD